MLLSTSAELVGIVQRHSSPIKINITLSLRKTLNKHLVLIEAWDRMQGIHNFDHVRRKHALFQDFDLFLLTVVCRHLEERLLSKPGQHCYS